jgi:hypothetical protein
MQYVRLTLHSRYIGDSTEEGRGVFTEEGVGGCDVDTGDGRTYHALAKAHKRLFRRFAIARIDKGGTHRKEGLEAPSLLELGFASENFLEDRQEGTCQVVR